MHITPHLLRIAALWILLVGLMFLSRPGQLPVVLLIVPFILLFGALLSLWDLLNRLRIRFLTDDPERQPSKRLGVAVCASLVLLLVLQSLGQLTARDVITVIAIVALGYAYVGRTSIGLIKR